LTLTTRRNGQVNDNKEQNANNYYCTSTKINAYGQKKTGGETNGEIVSRTMLETRLTIHSLSLNPIAADIPAWPSN
jgi:hypothetical protein